MKDYKFYLSISFLCGIGFGIIIGMDIYLSYIEKKCLYGERLLFSKDKVFSCTYMEGVKQK